MKPEATKGKKIQREGVFVFCCHITNYHKLSGLKQNNAH